jgi:PAS domain S-box-containing protein
MEYHILHIEDSETDADLVKRLLQKSGMNFTYRLAIDKNEVIDALALFEPNIILCDHSLPSFDSKMAYALCKEKKPGTPFILVTGTVSEEYAVEMMKIGVSDYLLKSNLQRLPIAIEHAVSKWEAEKIVTRNEKRFSALIENSADMKTLASSDGKLFYASPSVSKILCYTLDEFLNKTPAEIIHPDDIAGVYENVQKIMQTEGSSCNSQHRLKHKNGKYIWCEGTMTNLLNEPYLNAIVSNFRDISEKKKLELLLTEANNIARIGAWNVDLISGTIFWSNMTKAIHEADYNYIPDLATGLSFYKEGKMRDVMTQRVKEAIEDGKSWDEEMQIITVKNNERWIRTIGNTEFINGKCVRIYGSFQDIDQRKKAEEELREREKEIRTLAESMPHIVWTIDTQGQNTYFNRHWMEYTGLTLDESLGDGWLIPFHELDKPLAWDAWSNAVKTASEYAIECRLRKHDGSYSWWLIRGVPKINENKEIVKWYGTCTDIQQIKEKEKEIIKSETFNRSLINSITSQIAVVNEKGTITAVNNTWEHFGLSNGATTLELIGKGSNYFQACEKAAESGDNLAKIVLQGMKDVLDEKQKLFYYEYPCDSPTEKRWFSIRVMKFEGEEHLIITLHTDITDRKKEEQEKEIITKDLIRRNRNLEQFSYIISHNLRAPVANILGFAELLKIENSDPGLIIDTMKGMSVAAKNMDLVIRDLNEILNVSSAVSENKAVVHFQDLVEDISLSIDNLIKKENVIIRSDFKSVDNMLSIKTYLYSIFYNLILNSIKFHKPDIRPLIEIKSVRTLNGLQLIFKDNGMGIDLEKHQNNLFGLYKRFHLQVEGKGMGMFMVKTQVETLGGKISVSSEVNKGTEFTIEFGNIYL